MKGALRKKGPGFFLPLYREGTQKPVAADGLFLLAEDLLAAVAIRSPAPCHGFSNKPICFGLHGRKKQAHRNEKIDSKGILWLFRYHDLFSLPWWMLLATLIVPWLIWWKLVDKNRIAVILVFGLYMSLLVSLMDELGTIYDLWSYPTQLVRVLPRLYPVDFSFLPVVHMLLFQYFRNWRPYLIALAVVGAVFSFLGEPLFVWLDIYELDHWKYVYSLPIYIAKGLLLKWLVEKLMAKAGKQTGGMGS